jgi:hypothetical protein
VREKINQGNIVTFLTENMIIGFFCRLTHIADLKYIVFLQFYYTHRRPMDSPQPAASLRSSSPASCESTASPCTRWDRKLIVEEEADLLVTCNQSAEAKLPCAGCYCRSGFATLQASTSRVLILMKVQLRLLEFDGYSRLEKIRN